MNKAKMRKIALGAARSQLRRLGINPQDTTADNALAALDDAYRVDAQLIASLWYGEATNNQLALFEREWKQWQKRQQGN